MLCPKCNEELVFIINSRMDFRLERIPTCDKCKTGFRNPELGWKIEEAGTNGTITFKPMEK